MADFEFKAITVDGKTRTGHVAANNKQEAIAKLHNQHLKPLVIKQPKKSFNLTIPGTNKVKSKDLVVFTRQLSTMVSAGVPLTRALTTLEDQADSKYLKKVINNISKDVEGGMAIGEAMEKHPDVFDDVYVNMIKAGEAGGILDKILKRQAEQVEKNDRIKKKVKSAMTYPMVIGFITVGAFFFIMIFIIPKIAGILKDLGGEDAKLPPLTVGMLAISSFMTHYWWIIIIVSVITIILLKRYLKTPKGKYQFHWLLLHTPIVKNIIQKVAIARFSRTFSSMLASGVSVLESIQVTGGAIGNKVIEKDLLDAAKEVKNGHQLSEPISKSPYFPKIVSQMLAVGEETGEIDTILVKIADFYEEEVDNVIDSLSSIIEPVMIVVLGAMVGLVAASVMGPIASLSQNVK
jgi:type IV pilus assembly protein PilC